MKRTMTRRFKVSYDRDASAVTIDGENIGEFVVYMNDDLLDLDKPISVNCNGSELVTKVFERDLQEIFVTADTWGEYGNIFTASYRGFAPASIAAPEEGRRGEGRRREGRRQGSR